MIRPRTRTVAAAISLLLIAGSAVAEPTAAERLAARTLFEDGRTAMKNGDYGTACPKLEESQRLDPGIGTLYNLGSCYEGQGRLASAWTTFLEVAEAAQHAHEPDREAAARIRAAALEPRLPHLRVTLEGTDRRTLSMDGAPFAEGLVNTNVPIDPGGHEVGADAPSKKHWTTHAEATEAVTVVITVPALEDAELAVIPLVQMPLALPPLEDAAPPPPPPARASSWHTSGAIVAGALGVVGIGVGIAFGITAINDWSSAQSHGCSATYCPAGPGRTSWSAGYGAGNASTASFIVAGALLGTGAVVWFTRPKAAARVGVRPHGVVVEGRFP